MKANNGYTIIELMIGAIWVIMGILILSNLSRYLLGGANG